MSGFPIYVDEGMSKMDQRITGGREWPERYTYWPARRVGNLLFIAGTTGTDDTGRIVAPNDIAQQTR
jgi:enamine deaminase RidA (YjgF/YER057c/UK114 family)